MKKINYKDNPIQADEFYRLQGYNTKEEYKLIRYVKLAVADSQNDIRADYLIPVKTTLL